MKQRILLLLGAFLLVLSTENIFAQNKKSIYAGFGVSTKEALMPRVGYMINSFGVEGCIKIDCLQTFMSKELEKIDGKYHQVAFMGGLTWMPVSGFTITANVGYGTVGDYKYDAVEKEAVIVNKRKGLAGGASITIYPFFMSGYYHAGDADALGYGIFFNYTAIPAFGGNKPLSDFSFGFIYSLNLK